VNTLAKRKQQLEERLTSHHIEEKFFPSDDAYSEKNYDPVTVKAAGERLLTLLAVAFAAYNFDDAEKAMDWLKTNEIWKSVSEKEKAFFRDPAPAHTEKQELSWRFEGAYMIAWCLQQVEELPGPSGELAETHVKSFLQHIPPVGKPVNDFMTQLKFRALQAIIDEKLFYESCMLWFNHQREADLENSTSVHPRAAFERYPALAYVLMGNKMGWDELTEEEEN
jgi:hypothetical protein